MKTLLALLLLGLLVLTLTDHDDHKIKPWDVIPSGWELDQYNYVKESVATAQYTYNRNLDRVFSMGHLHANTPEFNGAVDVLMNSFCNDQWFVSWTARVDGGIGGNPVPPSIGTTKEQTRNLYEFYATSIYTNVSRHVVTSPIVTPFLTGNRFDGFGAYFNSSIYQVSTEFNIFASNLVWYNNTWLWNATSGHWCMSVFQTWCTSIQFFSSSALYNDAVITSGPDL